MFLVNWKFFQPIGEKIGTRNRTQFCIEKKPCAVSGVGSSPALATCETSQVLLAGVPGCFSRGSPVFAPPTDWPVS